MDTANSQRAEHKCKRHRLLEVYITRGCVNRRTKIPLRRIRLFLDIFWDSFMIQLNQMIMPVMVLALQTTAQLSRFTRASMLDNLNQDYVRTARAKGLGEKAVVLAHVLRNSLIPVVTVIALGVPAVFGGAIITEQVFKVNGIGQLFITALLANDLPMVHTVAFIFAILIVSFNLIADVLYGILDPRIRYD